jgi:1-acyl-sn-glycerol-3-phosphate acyltransferase
LIIIGFRIKGKENIPADGPCIIASNHVDFYDPLFLASAMPKRVLFFMAKQSLFEIPVFGRIIKMLGAFPVSRGEGDVSAIRRSVAILKENKTLAMFPEGTRSGTGELLQGLDGVGLIAERSKAPIIPVRLVKIKKRFRRTTLIIIGKPLCLDHIGMPEDKRERRKFIAAVVMESIALLGRNEDNV